MRSSSRRTLGQAGIEVKSTLPGLVDLDAENLGTRNGGFGVQRVRCIRFAGDGVTLPTDSATCVAPPVVVTRRSVAPGGGGGGVGRTARVDGHGRQPRWRTGARSSARRPRSRPPRRQLSS